MLDEIARCIGCYCNHPNVFVPLITFLSTLYLVGAVILNSFASHLRVRILSGWCTVWNAGDATAVGIGTRFLELLCFIFEM